VSGDVWKDPGRYYNRAGEPITFERWVLLLEHRGYQRLAFDEVDGYDEVTIGPAGEPKRAAA